MSLAPVADAPLRVLLVEDEPANRLLVEAVVRKAERLHNRPVSLVQTSCLADARTALAAASADVILLDVRLPDGSGLELASQVRAAGDRPWIIVMSASVHPAERTAAQLAGGDLFIPKPFRADELIRALGRVARGESPASACAG